MVPGFGAALVGPVRPALILGILAVFFGPSYAGIAPTFTTRARLPGRAATLVGRLSSCRGATPLLLFLIILFLLPSPVPAVAVSVDPPVIDAVEAVAATPVDHSEPVGVVHVEGGLTALPAEPCDLERIRRTQVPFPQPVSHEAGGETGAGRDHPTEVLLGPILVVPGPEVTPAVAVDLRRHELIVPGESAPARDVTVVAVHMSQPRTRGAEHAEVGHRPVVAVEDVDVAAAVAVEVAQDQLVVSGQTTPAGDVTVITGRHVQAGRLRAE